MKAMTKRLTAFLLVLTLCLSLLPAVELTAQAATVDYVYSGGYVMNWGTRGTTATFLSPMAEEFYEDNNVTYAALAALSGSSTESGVPSSALYKRLHSLMESNQDYVTSYNDTKDLFQYTDCQNSGKTTKKISSFYSGTLIGPSWNGGWNREHTWPNSKGDKAGNGENDLMMLRPTSTSENSSRGNKAYGQSSGYYNPNNESDGKYDLRGDVARIILYVYVRWQCTNTGSKYNPNGIFGTDGVFESKQVLLDWMEADPVDTWELGRNDSTESILGTRNVFVDYPELGFALFNEDVPSDYATPSGSGASSSYTITAVSGNTAHGTVSLNGNKITASPKTGYYASGYTVTKGNATVTRDGNVFTVAASSDCTVRIDFAAKTAAYVTYVQNGETVDSVTGLYVGDVVTLPSHDGDAPEDCTFMGWVTTPVTETGTKPTTLYLPRAEYNTVVANTTFYALYSYVGEGDGTGTGQWTLVTAEDQLHAGAQVVMACKEKGTVAGSLSSSYLSKVNATFSGNTIPSLPSDAQIMTLGGSSGAWTFANDSGKLLGATSVKNLAWGSGTTNWDISIGTDGAATIQNETDTRGRFLYNNSATRFTTYTSAANAGMILPQLYIMDLGGGTTLYSTHIGVEVECFHPDAYSVPGKAPTCTEPGYTAGLFCQDCEEYISGHEVLEPTNHPDAYEVTGKAPTCEKPGYTGGLFCQDCDIFLSGNEELPATGHSFANGVCTSCGATNDGIPGDLDNNGVVDEDDVIYLLQHLLMPGEFVVNQPVDYDHSGTVDEVDVIYLLQHLLMPEYFPLK